MRRWLCAAILAASFLAIPMGGHAALRDGPPPIAKNAPADVAKARAAWRASNGKEAVRLLFPLAVAGDPHAQAELGLLYHIGAGVEINHCVATIWFDKAARKGHAFAQYRLGLAYGVGHGVREDFVLMYLWLTAAMNNGLPEAEDQRYAFGVFLEGEARARAEALEKTWRYQDAPPADFIFATPDLSTVPSLDPPLYEQGLLECDFPGRRRP